MTDLLQNPFVTFTFIFLIPIVLGVGGIVSFFAVGALFDILDNPDVLKTKIEQAFSRPPKDPKTPGKEHYYRPYWNKAA